MWHHYTPVRMSKINSKGNNMLVVGVGKDMEKRETSCTVDGNVNLCSQTGKEYGMKFPQDVKNGTILL